MAYYEYLPTERKAQLTDQVPATRAVARSTCSICRVESSQSQVEEQESRNESFVFGAKMTLCFATNNSVFNGNMLIPIRGAELR